MVQAVNSQTGIGTINRTGVTEDGRIVYTMSDAAGKSVGKVSVPAKDSDVFEKSYSDVITLAPKLQKYSETHSSPKQVERRKDLSKWLLIGGGIVGAAIPIYLTRNFEKTWKQVAATAAGLLAGLAGGFGLSVSLTTPPGAMKLTNAMNNISKIDIQPVIE